MTLIDDLRADRDWGGKILLGLERAPAAKKNHHAREGGLVEHLLEMRNVAERWYHHLGFELKSEWITPQRIMKAILNHDIEKAYVTFELVKPGEKDPPDAWLTQYTQHPLNKLLKGDMKSAWLLNRYGIMLDEVMMNALFWAHGGFSELKTEDVSALGKMMYLVDEFSGNVMERIRTKTDLVRPHNPGRT